MFGAIFHESRNQRCAVGSLRWNRGLHPLQACDPTLKWETGTRMELFHPSSLDFAAFSPCLFNSQCSHSIPVLNQVAKLA